MGFSSIQKLRKDYKTRFLWYCNRGHKNHRYLRISDFSTGTDDEDRRFIYMCWDHANKNHKEGDITSQGGRMLNWKSNNCTLIILLSVTCTLTRFRHRGLLRSWAVLSPRGRYYAYGISPSKPCDICIMSNAIDKVIAKWQCYSLFTFPLNIELEIWVSFY